MTPGQPDFVFADPEDGVLAVEHEGEILYSSLYWRARTAVNFLARVHSILPSHDRIAVVHEDTKFTPSGFNYVRPDWVNMGFGNGGISYPDGVHSAHSGEKLPIALVPAGTAFKLGDERPGRGRGFSIAYDMSIISLG